MERHAHAGNYLTQNELLNIGSVMDKRELYIKNCLDMTKKVCGLNDCFSEILFGNCVTSYCQMLVTGISGGALDQLFSIFEFDVVDDLGEAFGTVEAAPFLGC